MCVRHGSAVIKVPANKIARNGEKYFEEDNNCNVKEPNGNEHYKKTNPFNEVDEDVEDKQESESVLKLLESDKCKDTAEHGNQGDDDSTENDNSNGDTHEGEINIDTDMEVNVRNKETAVVDKEKDFDTDVYNDDMVVEVIGKRKRNEHEGTSEKMIGLEDAESRVVPIKKVTGFPSKSRRTYNMYPQSKQAKIALKRGDFIEFDNDGQVMKATVINREKASGKFYNYLNVECDDGVTRNIDELD